MQQGVGFPSSYPSTPGQSPRQQPNYAMGSNAYGMNQMNPQMNQFGSMGSGGDQWGNRNQMDQWGNGPMQSGNN